MKDLLTSYSIEELIIVFFMAAVALKEAIELFRYFYNLIAKRSKKQLTERSEIDRVMEKLAEFEQVVVDFRIRQQEYLEKINVLIGSDREDIKSFIVSEHHYYVHNQKWIDDYSMDVLEKRFSYYQQEGGNSYAEKLMNEIRALPNIPPVNEQKQKE